MNTNTGWSNGEWTDEGKALCGGGPRGEGPVDIVEEMAIKTHFVPPPSSRNDHCRNAKADAIETVRSNDLNDGRHWHTHTLTYTHAHGCENVNKIGDSSSNSAWQINDIYGLHVPGVRFKIVQCKTRMLIYNGYNSYARVMGMFFFKKNGEQCD